MANNIYIVDQLATGTSTVRITDDGTGIDWLVIQGVYAEATYVNLQWEYSGAASDGIPLSARGSYYFPSNTGHALEVVGQIENARGSNGVDWLAGNSLNNLLFGDAARTGLGGNDTIGGGSGDDTIYGGSGHDEIGGSYDDDNLFGDEGRDTLSGGSGADTLVGGAGADSLSGGADGTDWVSYLSSSAAVDVRLISGDTSTSFGGDAEGDRINGVNHVQGSNFGDKITDRPESNAYNANRFDGMAGNDLLTMGGGQDTGYGGAGSDTLYGQDGNDRLFGGDGRDTLSGGAGHDVLYGGTDYDWFDGGADNDTIHGTDLRNVIYGGSGNDSLMGNAGNDLFFGGSGGDRIYGGADNDDLNGGAGRDWLVGGVGADDFIYLTAAEAGTTAETRDVIADFSRAQGDHIALNQLLNGGTFRGTGNFTGQAGDVRVEVGTSHSIVLIDLDGNRAADMAIQVLNVRNLAAQDFVL